MVKVGINGALASRSIPSPRASPRLVVARSLGKRHSQLHAAAGAPRAVPRLDEHSFIVPLRPLVHLPRPRAPPPASPPSPPFTAGPLLPRHPSRSGFGRIGRLAFRLAYDNPALEFVHINEHPGAGESSAYLAKYDSVHGHWTHDCEYDAGKNAIVVDGTHEISYSAHDAPGDVPWEAHGVELVLECSGEFLTREKLAPYFARGGYSVFPRRTGPHTYDRVRSRGGRRSLRTDFHSRSVNLTL
tara:strand:+ start:169 stop:897 length:729 start_codon:yes stop_codon:yes gene_type:complete